MTTINCTIYGHDWANTQPTRLRAPHEDDESLRCTQCGHRRFVNPGPTKVGMPTGFCPITLQTLHYDTTGNGGILSATEIYIRQRNGLPQKTTLRRIMSLYPRALVTAAANKWPEDRGNLTFQPWHELRPETKIHIANLADGPVSAHLLTEKTVLDATTIPHDQPSERISVQEHLAQWLSTTKTSNRQRHSTIQLVQICADPMIRTEIKTQILEHLENSAELPAGTLEAMCKIRPLMLPKTPATTILQLLVSPDTKPEARAEPRKDGKDQTPSERQ